VTPRLAEALRLGSAALLLVDFQNDFLAPGGLVQRLGLAALTDDERNRTIANARSLAESMRSSGRPVVWALTILRPDHLDSGLPKAMSELGLTVESGFLVEGSWGAELVPEVRAGPDDVVLVKKGPSAFQFTYLDRLLTNLGVSSCIIAGGGVLDGLPESVRQGGALGYEMIIASDACGYAAGSSHLRNLWNRGAIASTDDILQALRQPPPAERPSRTALLVVDLQNDFVHEEGAQHVMGHNKRLTAEQRETIVRNNERLVDAMHATGNAVVFAVTTQRPDMLDVAAPPIAPRNKPVPAGLDYLVEGSWGAQVMEGVAVGDDDLVIGKKGRSAFGFTPLHRILRNLGVRHCIVTGGGIHGCVEDTIREGAALGYTLDIASDAVYEPDSPNLEVIRGRASLKPTAEIVTALVGERRPTIR